MAIKVYLSSTFMDLQFERRAVWLELQSEGFEVLRMEDNPHLDSPNRWSVDTIQEADVFIHLFDSNAGTMTSIGVMNAIKLPYVYWEVKWSRHYTVKQFFYRLHRPFPDEDVVVWLTEEQKEYRESVAHKSYAGSFDAQSRYILEKEITDIYNATDLLKTILHDVKKTVPLVIMNKLITYPKRLVQRLFAKL